MRGQLRAETQLRTEAEKSGEMLTEELEKQRKRMENMREQLHIKEVQLLRILKEKQEIANVENESEDIESNEEIQSSEYSQDQDSDLSNDIQ